MFKILVRLPVFMTVVASLAMLTIVSSCDTPASSFSERREIVTQIFPSAVDIVEIPFFIGQGVQLSGRPDSSKVSEIRGDSGLLGYNVESKVVSRSGPFRIRILLDPQLYVKQATVISYPWDRGRDVCKLAFTSQFDGKGPADPIRLGQDIDAMSGATISSRVMADGVRNSIKLIKALKEKQPETQTSTTIPNPQATELELVKSLGNKETTGGEVLYLKKCSSCHQLIDRSAYSKSEWQMYVYKYGEEMTADEKAEVMRYLASRTEL